MDKKAQLSIETYIRNLGQKAQDLPQENKCFTVAEMERIADFAFFLGKSSREVKNNDKTGR